MLFLFSIIVECIAREINIAYCRFKKNQRMQLFYISYTIHNGSVSGIPYLLLQVFERINKAQ